MKRESDASINRSGDLVFIPGDYQHRARTNGIVVQRFWHFEKERMIRKFSPTARGDNVLDVGCGSGVVSDLLASMGAQTTGVDANPEAIAYARSTFQRPNLAFRVGLVDDLDLPRVSLDRVYCLELLEHVYEHQARQLFSDLHGLTKPGGVLTVTTPNYHGTWPAIEWLMDAFSLAPKMSGDQHVTRFSRRRLEKLFEQTGWSVQTLTTFSTFAPFLSLLGWSLAQRAADVEDSISLPFGNILFAVAVKVG